MPHVDITMIPGRDDNAKRQLAQKVQAFLARELRIEEQFVSVSIEDVSKEQWGAHMAAMTDKIMFVAPFSGGTQNA